MWKNLTILILLTILFTITLWWIVFTYKNIWDLSLTEDKSKDIKVNNKVSIEYNNTSLDSKLIERIIIWWNNSSILTFNSDNKSFEVLVPKEDEERAEKIKSSYKNNVDKFSLENSDKVYVLTYSYNFLKNLLEKQVNLWKEQIITRYVKETKDFTISDTELTKYFDDLSKLEIWNSYISDKLVDYSFLKFFNQDLQVQTVYKLKLKDIVNRKWFDMSEWNFPIVTIEKNKYQGTGLLVSNFNNTQKEKITWIFKNMPELIKSSEFIKQETDNKSLANWNNQSIVDFTKYTPEKYYQYFLKQKEWDFLYKEITDYWILIETKEKFLILYFDKNLDYSYKKENINSKWKNYIFSEIEYIDIDTTQITEALFKEMEAELEKQNIEKEYTYYTVDMLYNNIIYNK